MRIALSVAFVICIAFLGPIVGVQASFAIQGRLVRTEVRGSTGGLKTAFAMRNL